MFMSSKDTHSILSDLALAVCLHVVLLPACNPICLYYSSHIHVQSATQVCFDPRGVLPYMGYIGMCRCCKK